MLIPDIEEVGGIVFFENIRNCDVFSTDYSCSSFGYYIRTKPYEFDHNIYIDWMSLYRMTRAQMLSLREEEYVQALRAFGLSRARICFKHILPNALGPIMVNITLSTAMFILQEAGLSFLGLGVPLNIPTWGNILNVAQDLRILQN